jgi:hypothetical protein
MLLLHCIAIPPAALRLFSYYTTCLLAAVPMLSVTLTTPMMKTHLIYHHFLTSFKQMLTLLSTLNSGQLKLGMPSLLQGLLVMMRVRRLEYIFGAIEAANQRLDRRVQG